MMLRLSKFILLVALFSVLSGQKGKGPSFSAECNAVLSMLNGKEPTDEAIENALHRILPEEDPQRIKELATVAVLRIRKSMDTNPDKNKQARRIIARLIAKLVVERELNADPEELATRTLNILNGVGTESEIEEFLTAHRKGGEEAQKALEKIERVAAARNLEALRQAEAEQSAAELQRRLEADANHELSKLRWISGADLKLPVLTKFSPSREYGDLTQTKKATRFEWDALKWIDSQGEEFYAIGTLQVTALEPERIKKINGGTAEMGDAAGQERNVEEEFHLENADAISVSRIKGQQPVFNIREFKTDLKKDQKAVFQIQTTLLNLLRENSKAIIGKLEVLIPAPLEVDSPTRTIYVNGQPYTVTFRQIPSSI